MDSLLRCPQCGGLLRPLPERYACSGCPREYPVRFGIPDLRLSPDPYISFEDEHEKARILAEASERLSFEELVRFYWEITPDVPRPATERYVRYAMGGVSRGTAYLEAIDADAGEQVSGELCLDIGCGTGGFLAVAGDRFGRLIGADIALRWLIVARKRLASTGTAATLICCSAENLPFADGTFEQVVGAHMLEHTGDAGAALAEAGRVLKEEGRLFFSTPNRFSLGPEPCVRVWGVGFLPRKLAGAYVRWVKGVPYRNIRLLSWLDLRRALSNLGLREWSISTPRIAQDERNAVSRFAQPLITVYHSLHKLPVFSQLFRVFGPLLQVMGRK